MGFAGWGTENGVKVRSSYGLRAAGPHGRLDDIGCNANADGMAQKSAYWEVYRSLEFRLKNGGCIVLVMEGCKGTESVSSKFY